jgi:endonuclease/exonuclease/phosphatase family metal-dependent hydrolase
VPLLVRTWNLFHGNAVPPERRAFLRQMVELVTADEPDVVCLQEVPVWALTRLAAWSGMAAYGAVAARPRLGSAELGRLVTHLHHGVLRSAVTGQANAILVARRHRVSEARSATISRRGDGERRVCQAVRVEGLALVGNFHATGRGALADTQFLRAAAYVDALVRPGEPVVLCGDANVRPGFGVTYDELHDWGFSAPAPGIDQVLVRGLASGEPSIWPEERRRVGGRLLSDHAPVEVLVA